jgi:hypothetical protein
MATELKGSASVGGLFCFVARLSELELAEQIEVLLNAKSMEDAVERTASFRRRARGQGLRIEAARNEIQFGVGQSGDAHHIADERFFLLPRPLCMRDGVTVTVHSIDA